MAETFGFVVWPLECSQAALTASYAMLKADELYSQLCWHASRLAPEQIGAESKYPAADFQCWVRYGAWSHCPSCGVFFFNDKYFRDHVYQQQATSQKPCLLSVKRMRAPSDPAVHSYGEVGVSSRWWYLAPMYKPSSTCGA